MTTTQVSYSHATTSPSPGRTVRGFLRRRPLASFMVLSCLLSWWGAIPYLAGVSPIPIASFGPFLAALVILGMTEGRGGVRQLLGSMVRWRVPFRAYAFAVAVPTVVSGLAVLATIATGATAASAKLAAWTDIPVVFLVVLLIPGFAGAWEEPGFRGFALPRLEQRFGAAGGPLLLGVFWVFWHLPLFLAGQIEPTDVAVIVAASVVAAAVFHTGRESVLVAMVLHATNNAVGGSYASQIFHGSDLLVLGVFTAIGWWVAAAYVLVRQRRRPALGVRR